MSNKLLSLRCKSKTNEAGIVTHFQTVAYVYSDITESRIYLRLVDGAIMWADWDAESVDGLTNYQCYQAWIKG